MQTATLLRERGSRGIALPLVVVIITVLFISVFAILRLMRGAGAQASYSDAHVRALAIAESGIQLLIARFMAQPWEDRWFRLSPDYHGSPVSWEGGTFIYAIQDTPAATMSADIWVKSEYRNTRRLLFYRVKYQDLLFKGLTNPAFSFTASIEDESQTPLIPATVDGFTAQMNQLIDQKEKTRGSLADKWDEISDKVSPQAILNTLNARVPPGDIPTKSTSPEGASTDVIPPPKLPVSAGGTGTLENYNRNEILDWIRNQGYEDELVAHLMGVCVQAFTAVDSLIRQEKYTDAERRLKALLKYLHRTSRRVNALYTQAKMRYRAALDALDQEAQQTSMPQADYQARKAALQSAFKADLQGINNEYPAS